MKNNPANTPKGNNPKKSDLNTDNSVVNGNGDEELDTDNARDAAEDDDSPVLDEQDLEEDDLSEDEADEVEWDESEDEDDPGETKPGDKEKII